MLESTVELLGSLCLSALISLIEFCIVGSMVAALRAVSRASPTVSTKRKVLGLVTEATVGDDHNRDMTAQAQCAGEMQHG
jgi:hypothetical protein